MLKNFLWQREDEPQNMLSYLFLFQSLMYGITFTFFSFLDVVQRSPYSTSPVLDPVVFGVLCLVLVGVTLYGIQTRNRAVGTKIGYLGVALWTYSAFLYIASGALFAALAIHLPQILFWVFWGVGIRRYFHKNDLIRAQQTD